MDSITQMHLATLNLFIQVIIFDLCLAAIVAAIGVSRTIRKNKRMHLAHAYNMHKSDLITRPIDIHLKR